MLTLTRDVLETFEPTNCVILDLPDGSRIRMWIVVNPKRRGRGSVRAAIDAPKSVVISRGELLTPENSRPN